jgi:hypothetical protein
MIASNKNVFCQSAKLGASMLFNSRPSLKIIERCQKPDIVIKKRG